MPRRNYIVSDPFGDDDDDDDDDEDDFVFDEFEYEGEAAAEEEEELRVSTWPPLSAATAVGSTVSGIEEMVKLVSDSTSGGCGEGEDSQKLEWNREDVEGLFCPICMEPWTASGEHQPSCLTCGHLFGVSCIKKWLGQRKNSGKCPQCNKKCTLKDVRRIYGSRVVVVDEESQKRIRYLEAKCDSLVKKDDEWHKKEAEWHLKLLVLQKKDVDISQKLQQLQEREDFLQRKVAELGNKSLVLDTATDGFQLQSSRGVNVGLAQSPVSSNTFKLQARYQALDKRRNLRHVHIKRHWNTCP